jgi:tetratricopeptide (TPR) repeat protein
LSASGIGGATREQVLASFGPPTRIDAHEQVLALDPTRRTPGSSWPYRYLVAAMSLPVRLLACASFGGGREQSQMVEEPHRTRTNEPTRFALLLLYNRERRFDDALRVVGQLRNNIHQSTALVRAGRRSFARNASNRPRPSSATASADSDRRRDRMFGEESLWRYKRGLARARLGHTEAARADLQVPVSREARDWVRGRAHAELGQLAQKAGDRELARREYRLAIELADRGNDPAGRAEADALLSRLR